jgi:hypothetical protein
VKVSPSSKSAHGTGTSRVENRSMVGKGIEVLNFEFKSFNETWFKRAQMTGWLRLIIIAFISDAGRPNEVFSPPRVFALNQTGRLQR